MKTTIFICILVASVTFQPTLAQTVTLQPIGYSYLMQSNPAFSGSKYCTHFGINLYAQQKQSQFGLNGVKASIASKSDVLMGGIGMNYSGELINGLISEQNTSVAYAYNFVIDRNLSIALGLKAGYAYLKTDPSQLFELNQPTSQLHKGSIDIGSGLLLYSQRAFLGFSMDDFLRPVELEYQSERFRKPIFYSSILGLDTRFLKKSTAITTLQYEYQAQRFLSDSFQLNQSFGINQFTAQTSISRNWLRSGISYRYIIESPNVLSAHLGYTSEAIDITLVSGFSQSFESKNTLVGYYQVNIELAFPCRLKRRKYRSIQCPSFGGVSYRYSSGRPNGYSSYNSDLSAGTLTAGEVNDFEKWELWNDISKKELNEHAKIWSIRPEYRYTTQVSNNMGYPVIDAEVTFFSANNETIWRAKTDNTGKAELWLNLYENENAEPANIEVKSAESKVRLDNPLPFASGINHIELDENCSSPINMDILFVTDATGSMGDEIEYLKVELKNIIDRTQGQDSTATIRLGSMFYRCEGNSYTTKSSEFDSDFSKSIKFIGKQEAGEGGDEAVEIALTKAVHDFDWSKEAKARILFLILDEAPGNQAEKIKVYQKALSDAAAFGIRIVPLVASGVGHYSDKSLEYLMRSTALASNGTYAFFTNHSGIGNDHEEPETDEYDVERMNDMILRIIREFSTVHSCLDSEVASYVPEQNETKVDVIESVILDSNLRMAGTTSANDSTDSLVIHNDEIKTTPEPVLSDSSASAYVYTTQKKSFSFYPNPTTGIVNLKVEAGIETLYLADVNGKLLEKYDLKKGIEKQINLSRYPRGLYLIQYESKGKWYSGKIVLTR